MTTRTPHYAYYVSYHATSNRVTYTTHDAIVYATDHTHALQLGLDMAEKFGKPTELRLTVSTYPTPRQCANGTEAAPL